MSGGVSVVVVVVVGGGVQGAGSRQRGRLPSQARRGAVRCCSGKDGPSGATVVRPPIATWHASPTAAVHRLSSIAPERPLAPPPWRGVLHRRAALRRPKVCVCACWAAAHPGARADGRLVVRVVDGGPLRQRDVVRVDHHRVGHRERLAVHDNAHGRVEQLHPLVGNEAHARIRGDPRALGVELVHDGLRGLRLLDRRRDQHRVPQAVASAATMVVAVVTVPQLDSVP